MDDTMPQGRIVLKRICQSRKLAALKTDGARLLYTWLIPNVDVNGCCSGDAEVIKGQIFTRLRKSNKFIEECLLDLQENGLIVRYIVNGDVYLQIPDFSDKQPYLNPDRESKTNIPLPSHDQLMNNSSNTPSNLGQIESKSKIEIESKSKNVRFDKFYNHYPRKTNKQAAVKAFNKLNPDNALLEVMIVALEQQKLSDQWQRGVIPHPATWLNGKRWTDEMTHEETIEEQYSRIQAKKAKGERI